MENFSEEPKKILLGSGIQLEKLGVVFLYLSLFFISILLLIQLEKDYVTNIKIKKQQCVIHEEFLNSITRITDTLEGSTVVVSVGASLNYECQSLLNFQRIQKRKFILVSTGWAQNTPSYDFLLDNLGINTTLHLFEQNNLYFICNQSFLYYLNRFTKEKYNFSIRYSLEDYVHDKSLYWVEKN